MAITYETTFTITTENLRRGGTRIIRDVLVRELHSEQLTTIKKRAQCALFLKSNALLSHNKTINSYFKHFIENRDRSEKTTLKNLENVRQKYEQELDILSKAMDDSSHVVQQLEPSNIKQVVERLYSLKYVGPLLIKFVDYSKTANDQLKICKLIQEVKITQELDRQNLNVLQKIWNKEKGNKIQYDYFELK